MVKGNSAAIDLGTNSCRLAIADENGKLIYRETQTTKLGEKLIDKGCFTPQAIDRGLTCLEHYAEIMHQNDVQRYRAIATASCRMASNGLQFVQMAKELCGINLEIISPEEEAKLTLKGAILNADELKPYVLVFDIGGGSTEITFASNNIRQPEILYTISMPWGARNSSEAFQLLEYHQENADNLRQEVSKYTQKFLADSDFAQYRDESFCIATSSTPLRLVSMVQNKMIYEREKADGQMADWEQLAQQIGKVYKMNFVQMEENPLIGQSRAPIFTAACVIFETICRNLQLDAVTASLKGAQEAILNDFVNYSDDKRILSAGKIGIKQGDRQ